MMQYIKNTFFNSAPPTIMHVDINSCFVTIEQQANPLLRGKPTVVAAYTTDRGCILAASREAKTLGIKTGMRVGEGKQRYPRLVVLPSDPGKYRFINKKLTALLACYSPYLSVESIDEMVLDFWNTPKLVMLNNQCPMTNENIQRRMMAIGKEIKERVKREIGEWITVSIGFVA